MQQTNPADFIPLVLGESKKLGYNFSYYVGTIEIVAVAPDTPSAIAGFAVGDHIVAVDGKPLEREGIVSDIRDRIIRGEIESAVLDIRRDGQKMEYLLKK